VFVCASTLSLSLTLSHLHIFHKLIHSHIHICTLAHSTIPLSPTLSPPRLLLRSLTIVRIVKDRAITCIHTQNSHMLLCIFSLYPLTQYELSFSFVLIKLHIYMLSESFRVACACEAYPTLSTDMLAKGLAFLLVFLLVTRG
jgi:hypothetical protein